MNDRVFVGQYRIEDGNCILQCHSRGDKRYSSFFCYVKDFRRIQSRITTNALSVLKVAQPQATGLLRGIGSVKDASK
jgi:hypothetical protein